MQCQGSRGSFDPFYGDSIQVKQINYFAIKFPRYANKHWLKLAYTIVRPTAAQWFGFFCLYLLSFITCAVASSTHKYFPTFTFRIRTAQGGNSFSGTVSPQHAGSPQPQQAPHRHAPAHQRGKTALL